VAIRLSYLAALLQATNRLAEAELLMRRALAIFLDFTRKTRHPHPDLQGICRNYAGLLEESGFTTSEVCERLNQLHTE
jgi:hypothetical protein